MGSYEDGRVRCAKCNRPESYLGEFVPTGAVHFCSWCRKQSAFKDHPCEMLGVKPGDKGQCPHCGAEGFFSEQRINDRAAIENWTGFIWFNENIRKWECGSCVHKNLKEYL